MLLNLLSLKNLSFGDMGFKTNLAIAPASKTKNLHTMETLYGVIGIAHLWLSILGLDYIKNYNHIKIKINLNWT